MHDITYKVAYTFTTQLPEGIRVSKTLPTTNLQHISQIKSRILAEHSVHPFSVTNIKELSPCQKRPLPPARCCPRMAARPPPTMPAAGRPPPRRHARPGTPRPPWL
eukprot:scaffold15303_cov37-Prasinocladus_malaysianus.AAC.1